MWSDAMALGHGSKKSTSCDQGVTQASLSNGVSNTKILKQQLLCCSCRMYVTHRNSDASLTCSVTGVNVL